MPPVPVRSVRALPLWADDRAHTGRTEDHEIVFEPCGSLVVNANHHLSYAFVLRHIPIANGIAGGGLVLRSDGILQIEHHGIGTGVERAIKPVGPIAWYEEVGRR